MKERGSIITLDKSEYREIPSPESGTKSKIKPEVNPFQKQEDERITTLRLQSTRRELAEMPMLALILPVHEIPEKLPDFTTRNKFIDFMDAIFEFFGVLFGDDKEEKKQK